MDAPLVLSSRIDPEEIDDESHNLDIFERFPKIIDRHKNFKTAFGGILFNGVHLTVYRKEVEQSAEVVVMRVRNKNGSQIEKIHPHKIGSFRTALSGIEPVKVAVVKFQDPG